MPTPHTLMLLPGLMCDRAVWEVQMQALSPIAHSVVPAWDRLDSITAMAQRVLDQAPTERFAMAGHSMGGRVALEVMRLAPHRVNHLGLLNTGYKPLAPGEAGVKEREGRMALVALAREQGMRAMGRQWARGMVHPDRLDTPLFDTVLDMLERSNVEQFAAQQNALLNRPDAFPVLATVRVPTLVLTGEQDGWSGPVTHREMHEAIPGSTLVLVPQCGHMSTMERPEFIADALARWLTQAGS